MGAYTAGCLATGVIHGITIGQHTVVGSGITVLNDLPLSTCVADRVLSLPIYPSLTPEAISRVVDVLERAISHSPGE